MALVSTKCPNCGGDIQLDDQREKGFCLYCGSQIDVRATLQPQVQNITGSEQDIINWEQAYERFMGYGDFEKAEKILDKLIQAKPNDPEILKKYKYIQNGLLFEIDNNGVLHGFRSDKSSNKKTLTILDIPDHVKVIEDKAFVSCISLKEINFPKNLEHISYQAFAGCKSLETLNLPDHVKVIGQGAFVNCISLKEINFPKNLKLISRDAFAGCKSLESLTLPESLNDIWDKAKGSYTLREFGDHRKNHGIASDSFKNCSGLKWVKLPPNIEEISSNTFEGCKNLEFVTFPQKLKKISSSTFKDCINLKVLDFPDTLERIDRNAFEGCSSLEKVEFKDNLFSIGENAFANCNKLTKVHFSRIPTDIDKSAFDSGVLSEYDAEIRSIKERKLEERINSYAAQRNELDLKRKELQQQLDEISIFKFSANCKMKLN